MWARCADRVQIFQYCIQRIRNGNATSIRSNLNFKPTLYFEILYESKGNLDLCGFSDADYTGDKETRRSTSGFVFLLGGSAISWCSERQKSVAFSITESEYIATSNSQVKSMFKMNNQSAIRLI